jgi:hypothetical protein
MSLLSLKRKPSAGDEAPGRWIEPRLGPAPALPVSEVFDTGAKTVVDCAHVKVERLDTQPVMFSKVFKEFQDRRGHKYDYRYWAERENYFLREFLKKQSQFTHVVQARHLISENDAAKQVLTCDAGITIANWLRVKARYRDTATLSHPFQRADVFLRLVRGCLVALKEIHEHRIVHCDIKEDNICIPYSPSPFAGEGHPVMLDFEKLKLIDFAFSIAHSIPLTQVLVIDPAERLPYQSELLIGALHADRKSGSPNAVQQLDYRVDLFSLGYMAEKIAAAGLECPSRRDDTGLIGEILGLIQKLKAYDSPVAAGPMPHDGLIERVDQLLSLTGAAAAPQFMVDGEWTGDEMQYGHISGRQTPLTPVALPLPTPVARPVTPAPAPMSKRSRIGLGLVTGTAVALAIAFAGASTWTIHKQMQQLADDPAAQAAVAAPAKPEVTAPRSLPPEPEQLAAAHDAALGSADLSERSRAFSRLVDLAKAGSQPALKRIEAFENRYDDVKQSVAKSAWWGKGQGDQPQEAARWIDDGQILALHGDRPAMLDVAFAVGYGRALPLDRAAAANAYLKVIDRSGGADDASARLRASAGRGLSAVLNAIVEQQDEAAASKLRSTLEARAATGAADIQYYLGLMAECVATPPDLEVAMSWYKFAAADPAWKATAERKAELLGQWCPRRPG